MAPSDKFRSLAASRSNRQKKQNTSVQKLLGDKSEGTTSTAALTAKSVDNTKQQFNEKDQLLADDSAAMFSNDNFFEGGEDSWVVNPTLESKNKLSDKLSSDEDEWKAFDSKWENAPTRVSSDRELYDTNKFNEMDKRVEDFRSRSAPRSMGRKYSMEKIQHLAVTNRRAKNEVGKYRSSREYEEALRARKYLPEKLDEQDKVKMVDAMLALSRVADRQERKIKSYRNKLSGYKDNLDEKDDIIKELIDEREELRNIVIETRVQCKIYRNRAEDIHEEMMGIQQSMATLQVERDDYAARYSILASKLERDPTLEDDILTNNDTLTNEPSTKIGASSIGSSTFDVEKEALAHQVQALKEQLNDKVDQQVMLEYELAKQKEAMLAHAHELEEDERREFGMAPNNVTFKKTLKHHDVDSDVSDD